MQSKENFIVIVSTVPFPYGNASDNAIYTFMDGFQEHGCKGEVLCVNSNSPIEHKDVLPKGEYKGVSYRYLHGVTNKRGNIINYLRSHKSLRNFRFSHYIKRKCEQFNVTAVFVTHISKSFYDLSSICCCYGAKVVLTVCEYPEYLINFNEERALQFRNYAKNIDKYIFETKTLQDYYKKVLKKNINSIVIPATMPFDDILECKRTTDDCYIAYCGSIHSEAKDGLSNIIRAFAICKKSNKDITLRFVGRIGESSYFNELQNLIQELKINESVSFTGEVDRKQYVQSLINAKMMIVAKPKDSYYGGGLSSKVIEYLFSGNPVLMVDSDDYVYYLTHLENVYFVSDNSPETLSNALSYLLEHPVIMERIGRNGKDYALEKFNYHKLTKPLLDFLVA